MSNKQKTGNNGNAKMAYAKFAIANLAGSQVWLSGGKKIASSFLHTMTGIWEWLVEDGWKWGVLLGVYWWLVFKFYLVAPPVWPDEAIFADIARTWRESGSWGTGLWAGMVPGAESRFLQYPPGMFGLIALTQVFGGVSIWYQRLIPAVFGSVVLAGSVRLWRWVLGKQERKVWWLAGLLVIDFAFLYMSRLSRQEAVVLGCLVVSLNLLLVKGDKRASSGWKRVMAAGLVTGLGATTHPIALMLIPMGMLMLWAMEETFQKWKKMGIYGLGGLLPVMVWLGLNWQWWREIGFYFHLATVTKASFGSWFFLVASLTDNWMRVSLGVLQGVLVWSVIEVVRRRKLGPENLVVGWAVWAWVVAVLGRMLWYRVFPVYFSYLVLGYLYRLRPSLGKWLVAVVLGVNIWHLVYELNSLERYKPDYEDFSRKIEARLEPGSTVFLSVIPDVYFGLVNSDKEFNLLEFPALLIDPEQYGGALDRADYVVFGGENSGNLTGNYLEMYMDANTETSETVKSGLYKAEVVKLKPVADRREMIPPGGRFGDKPLQREIFGQYMRD